MDLRIATYNIRAGLSDGYFRKKDYHKAAEAVAAINADIITLNEVGKKLPKDISDHAGFIADKCGYKYYHFAVAHLFGEYPYGNAILSKFPIEQYAEIPVRILRSPVPGIYEPRCILSTHIAAETPVRVICTHLGLFPDEQRRGLRLISSLIESEEKLPTIVTGDMNISGHRPVITEKYGLKLRDACVLLNSPVNTYPSSRPRKRLDYIFVSEGIEVKRVYTIDTKASDHLPLAAEISI